MLKRILWPLLALLAAAALAIPATAANASYQYADVYSFADLPELADAGDARLTRTDGGIKSLFVMNDAPEGVYTLWWVIWNTPEGCETPFACNEPDLFNPDAGLAIGYAGGAHVGPGGNLNIQARLREGEELSRFATAEYAAAGVQLTESTMLDSRHAEAHLVLRTHGDHIPGLSAEMKRTFNGGCEYTPPIEGTAPAYGTPGPNICEDVFFAVFPSQTTP